MKRNLRDSYIIDCGKCGKKILQNSEASIIRTGRIYIEEYKTNIALGEPSTFKIICTDCYYKIFIEDNQK